MDPETRLAKLVATDRTDALITALRRRDSRRKAAGILGDLRERAAVPELVRLVRATHGDDRVAAIAALGRIGDRAAVEVLAEQLRAGADDKDRTVAALLALARIRHPAAVADVAPYVDSTDNSVRRCALAAIVMIGEEESVACANAVLQAMPRRRQRDVERLIEAIRWEVDDAAAHRTYARSYYTRRARGDLSVRELLARPPSMSPKAWRLGRVVLPLMWLISIPLLLVCRPIVALWRRLGGWRRSATTE